MILIHQFLSTLESVSARHALLVPMLIISLALLLRIAGIIVFPPEITQADDPFYYLKIAESVESGNGFREGNLLAYRPPLYPLFIAGVFSVFGNDLNLVRILQAVLASISCLIVFFIGKRIFGFSTGVLAAAFCAVYPQFIHFSIGIWSEQLFTFLMILSLFLVCEGLARGGKLLFAAAGIVTGLAILTRDSAGLFLIGVLIWIMRDSRTPKESLTRCFLVAVCVLIAVAPWTIRNYTVFGKIVPVSTNGGINFYMGNNPDATGGFNWKLPDGAIWNEPSPNGQNEITASSLGFQQGFEFILENPLRFFQLVGARLFYLFRPPTWTFTASDSIPEIVMKVVWVGMYLALFVVTFILAPYFAFKRRGYFVVLFQLMFWLMVPFLISYGGTRYRLPIEALMAIVGAAATSAFIGKLDRAPLRRESALA